MGKVADYIAKNNEVVLNLIKMNVLPLSVMQNYEIYQMYLALDDEPKIMKRYEKVANRCKCCIDTVRNAKREMEKAY